MAFSTIVLSYNFTLDDIADVFFAGLVPGALGPPDALRFRFVDPHRERGPDWEGIPRKPNGEFADEVLFVGVGPSNLDRIPDVPYARCHELLLERLVSERDEARRPMPDPATIAPDVRFRLPEFVQGSMFRLAADDLDGRRALLEETLVLLERGARILAENPDADPFAFGTLLRATPASESGALSRAGLQAFAAVQREILSERRAREDLTRAKIETLPVVGARLDPDGRVVFTRREAEVVWVWSNEECLVRVARAAGADVVVQFRRSEHRVLIVARDRVGGLAHVAAMLRNADAFRRSGTPPEQSTEACLPGLNGPGGSEPVFRLEESGDVVGNFDVALPKSALRGAELERAIRAVLVAGQPLAERAEIDPELGAVSARTLAAACRPERL